MAGPKGPSAPAAGQGGGGQPAAPGDAGDSPTYSSDGPKRTGSSEDAGAGFSPAHEPSAHEHHAHHVLPHAPRLTRLSVELIDDVRAAAA